MTKAVTTESGDRVIIEIARTKREVLSYLDEYLYNLSAYQDGDEISEDFILGTYVEIAYEDGTQIRVDSDHSRKTKVRRQHITGIMYSGIDETLVYGNYEVNAYGVVHLA